MKINTLCALIALSIVVIASLACQTTDIFARYIATPTPACEVKSYLDQSSKIWDKFFDETKRANSTSRIALTSVIGEMQSTKREFANLAAPPCATEYANAAVYAMDGYIDAYLGFMAQESNSTVAYKLSLANARTENVITELRKLRALITPSPR